METSSVYQSEVHEVQGHETQVHLVEESVKSYELVVAYSSWGLPTIRELFESQVDDFGEEDYSKHVGPMRVDRVKNAETNRTICLISRRLYDEMVRTGHNRRAPGVDFSFNKYVVRQHNFPKTGESDQLFVPLPPNLTATECRTQLEEKLDSIHQLGVVAQQTVKVTIPLKSRDRDEHKGLAFVVFGKEADLQDRTVVKLMLHDTWWYGKDNWEGLAKCYWAKDREEKKGSESGKLSSGPARVWKTRVAATSSETLAAASEPVSSS